MHQMFEEQVGWCAEKSVDLVIGETYDFVGEARIALDVIKQAGLSSVITLAINRDGLTRDGITPAEACRQLRDADGRSFPTALDSFTCTRYEVAHFAEKVYRMGFNYIGLCCGAGPHHIRAMAEALGRTPPASRYSPDMSKHFAFGGGGCSLTRGRFIR